MQTKAPFLIIYNRQHEVDDGLGHELGRGLPNYFIKSGKQSDNLKRCDGMIQACLTKAVAECDACLVIDLQPIAGKEPVSEAGFIHPRFEIDSLSSTLTPNLLKTVVRELETVCVDNDKAVIVTKQGQDETPATSLPPSTDLPLFYLRIELTIPHQLNGQDLPHLRRQFHGEMYRVLLRIGAAFAKQHTKIPVPTPYALAKRTLLAPDMAADGILDQVGQSCDLLPFVTPTNGAEAFADFKRSQYQKMPSFLYRPLSIDPYALFRRLYACPIEQVDDPDLRTLFQRTIEEYDIKISMLADVDTPNFFYNSLRLFGPVAQHLEREALRILNRFDAGGPVEDRTVTAQAFANAAVWEIDKLRQQDADIQSTVTIAKSTQGLLVSNGHLHIGANLLVSKSRVPALLAHEVGTHIVTYLNGREQPLKILCRGLAATDELQEALALIAESAAGCLPSDRMRLLAARVIAVVARVDGADFIQTFRILHGQYEISESSAFDITMRVFRGGGFTKDAMYLNGLVKIASGALRDCEDYRYLYAGKFGFRDAGILLERLAPRGLVKPAKYLPPFLCVGDEGDRQHLWNRYRNLESVDDLITNQPARRPDHASSSPNQSNRL